MEEKKIRIGIHSFYALVVGYSNIYEKIPEMQNPEVHIFINRGDYTREELVNSHRKN